MITAGNIGREVRAGRRSAREILASTLARIDALDPAINAFTARVDPRARERALRIDRDVAAGIDPGPLAGVPFAVKNLYDIEGITTIAGARLHASRPPATADATLVARLEAHGAVLVGALNMDAYAYGFTTENTHYGVTRNPHDARMTAGGSSGGSAAAIAADMVPLTLGSDTNGSIRVPASFCGVFGLRPTFGRLSRAGTLPFVHELDVLGPFAGCTEDLALAFDAMAGPDPRDPGCSMRPPAPVHAVLHEGVADLRIGVARGYFTAPLAEESRRAVELAARCLGARIDVEVPEAARARAAAFVLTASTAGALYLSDLRHRAEEFEPLSRDRLRAGALAPAAWRNTAERFRRWYHDAMLALFHDVDAVLAPATVGSAFPLGSETLRIEDATIAARADAGIFTQPISFAGFPVAAVPVDAGTPLPIGIQVIAAPWREDVCLRIAAELERRNVACARIVAR